MPGRSVRELIPTQTLSDAEADGGSGVVAPWVVASLGGFRQGCAPPVDALKR